MTTAIGRSGPETLQSLDRALKINEGRVPLPALVVNSVVTGASQALPENSAAVALLLSGSYTGLVFSVDMSDDGTNWDLGVRGWSSQGSSGATSFTPGTDAIKRYMFPTNGAAFYRVRSTAFTTGSTAITATSLPKFTTPSDTTGTQAVSGTVTATVAAATLAPLTTSGMLRSRVVSAATTNSNLIATGAKKLYAIHAFNTAATDVFLKLYNKATAPTVGTDTPVMTFVIPGKAAGTDTVPFVLNLQPFGDAFSLGLGIGITGAIGDTDTTAITASSCIVNTHYL